ncbi:hypothetical protein AMJ44_03080 [candidate division WOR-1 bacterium DG_54_3]|jgi:uncharacterized protein YgiM (DUF1202 family)|uniref:SH3b domain-containing protein n=1 Tax=candidate division WOR-1 bacterium DG_54_3 TaxID=1703775 RepID=A0A0S7Y4W3_UNCSA|nr:MAG: hypothetical protein AMJ44_03080 [candidate division WOR-1 bacterium DG_54_3]
MIMNRHLRNKAKILIIGIALSLNLVAVSQAVTSKIKVKTKMANIHQGPDFKSQVINQVPWGTVLDLEDKRGKWYKVNLSSDKKGIVLVGYIHQDYAEEITEAKEDEKFKAIMIEGEEPGYKGELITIRFKDADVRDVIMYLCRIGGLNVVFDPEVSGKVSCDLRDVPWDQALDVILKINRLGKVIEGKVLRTGKTNRLIKQEKDKRK